MPFGKFDTSINEISLANKKSCSSWINCPKALFHLEGFLFQKTNACLQDLEKYAKQLIPFPSPLPCFLT